ncbi:MAG: GatB/YqeY domain-containing protein [Candidatus Woesebacteria bacterium]
MLMDTILNQIKDAMRAKDSVKLETLRFILSTIKYVQIEKRRDLTDEEILDVLTKEVKKRREAIELFKKSGRDGLVTEEETKLAVITAFLPAQMSADEVAAIVNTAIAKVGTENMGMLMKEVMMQTKGKADGKMVSDLVRSKLAA